MSSPLAETEKGIADDRLLGQMDMFGHKRPDPSGVLRRRFGYPPFSVLSARNGEWAERRQQWLALGISGKEGREHVNTGGAPMPGTSYDGTKRDPNGYTVSSFDPVLVELVYKWFCPANGIILDPFSGGATAGVVAGAMRRHFIGIDIRPEQVTVNTELVAALNFQGYRPHWLCGDSQNIGALGVLPSDVDFLFSCPPYGSLEQYSNDPRDISTMKYWDFTVAHSNIIRQTCQTLAPDRFAAWVVGDYRDKSGCYVGFVADTIYAFQTAGLRLYNDAILVMPVGSLPVRVGHFASSRKLGKAHQNLLVFVKGDGKRAAAQCESTES